jgi:hypothetical protein
MVLAFKEFNSIFRHIRRNRLAPMGNSSYVSEMLLKMAVT